MYETIPKTQNFFPNLRYHTSGLFFKGIENEKNKKSKRALGYHRCLDKDCTPIFTLLNIVQLLDMEQHGIS